MRRWMTGWTLAALVAAVVSFGGMGSALAQPFDDSEDEINSRQEKPGITERLRQWFEGERQAMKERAEERGQARPARRGLLNALAEAYRAGYTDGYHDAVEDHMSLMRGPEQRPALERGLTPLQRERFRSAMRDRIRSNLRQPVEEFDMQQPFEQGPQRQGPQEY